MIVIPSRDLKQGGEKTTVFKHIMEMRENKIFITYFKNNENKRRLPGMVNLHLSPKVHCLRHSIKTRSAGS